LHRFDTIQQLTDGQKDRRTDRQKDASAVARTRLALHTVARKKAILHARPAFRRTMIKNVIKNPQKRNVARRGNCRCGECAVHDSGKQKGFSLSTTDCKVLTKMQWMI